MEGEQQLLLQILAGLQLKQISGLISVATKSQINIISEAAFNIGRLFCMYVHMLILYVCMYVFN